MRVEHLLAELFQLGIEIKADGERLRYRAPKGVLSEEIRLLLTERKAEILSVLRAGEDGDREPEVVADLERRYEPFPLTEIQQAYVVGRSGALELGNVACHAYQEYDAEGLDLERFTNALRRLIERHDALRLIILPDGRQRILEEVPAYGIEVLNLRGLAAQAAEAELAEVRKRMSHQVRPIDQWPLFEIRASLVDGGRIRLHMSFDLLIGDAWSFLLFFRELFYSYEHPESVLPKLELSFRDCVLAEAEFKKGERYRRSQEYWRGRVPMLASGPELPLVKEPRAIERPEFVRRTGSLDAGSWQRLKSRAARAGLTPSGVLCAVLAEVLGVWSRSARFTLNVTLFNRLLRHPEINEIMGDFTATLLLGVDGSGEGFEQRAQRLQEQLWKDLEHCQVSGISVLRELSAVRRYMVRGSPVVFSSALIDNGRAGREAATPLLRGYGVSQTPQVLLDNQVREDAGTLVFNWDAVEEAFPPGLLDDMFQAYGRFLVQLAEEASIWQEVVLTGPDAEGLTSLQAVTYLTGVSNTKIVREVATPANENGDGARVGSTPAEAELIARIGQYVTSILGIQALEPESNLLSLGATSIHMIRIVNLIDRELAFRPSVEAFYRNPTVAGLVRLYADARRGSQAGDKTNEGDGRNGRTFQLILDPEEREAFKKTQPGLRHQAAGQAVYPFSDVELSAGKRSEYLRRRSRREFVVNPIPVAQFGEFLSCLRQRTIDGRGKYRYGSAGGLYPVQTYCYVKPGRVTGLPGGIYYYHPVKHRLLALKLGVTLDRETYDPFINRPIFDQAGFALFLVARIGAIAPMYGEPSLRFATLEAGAITQLLETIAPNHGLGLCQVGEMDFERIRPLFALEETDLLAHSMLGGAVTETRTGESDESAQLSREMKLLEQVKQLSTEEVKALLKANRKAEVECE